MIIMKTSFIGLLLLLCAFGIAVYCTYERSRLYPERIFGINKTYWRIIGIAILGDIIALIGFIFLSYGQSNPCVEYSNVLTILSLLSAGAIASNFAFSYQTAKTDESSFTFLLAVGYKILFLLLFGSLSFYIGKSVQVSKAEWIQIIVPVIMFIIVFTNTIFDFWDYRDVGKGKGKREKGERMRRRWL